MSEHDKHHEHPSAEDALDAGVPLTPDDAGSRALSDALQSSFWIVKILMGALVVIFFLSGFFTVGPQERAVILRFGKPVGQGEAALRGPGAHWAWPAPIDEVVKVPFSQVQEARSSVGWFAVTPEQEATRTLPDLRETLDPAHDSYLLTGDANIIHVRAALRYRISDPLRFIFGFTNAPALVTNALNNALCYAAAQFSVDDALTRNQLAFRERIERRIDQLAAQQQLGIVVEQVTFAGLIPPRKLADKFREVSQASVRTEGNLSGSKSYANEALSKARSDAAARIGLAESDGNRLVEAVRSEADFFTKVLPEYRRNPELFMSARQMEVMGRVFMNAEEVWFRPSYMSDRLDLSRQPLKPKATPAPAAPKDDHH
ncbi:MAG TPA: protease modulator HflK [Methylomirabilota bacterium]|nr:protease modulator HflK [Methylomirabilota bacterium]